MARGVQPSHVVVGGPLTPKRKTGRPKGRMNSVPYRSGVAREVLKLRIPAEAPPEVKALGEQARALIERALRSRDHGVFCPASRRPRGVSPAAFRFRLRVAAALYVLREIGREPTAVDLLADIIRDEEDPSSRP